MTHIASSDRAQQPALPDLRWITVWFRAVVIPASRRADAAVLGSAIVGALISAALAVICLAVFDAAGVVALSAIAAAASIRVRE
jgi:hypothetical protein